MELKRSCSRAQPLIVTCFNRTFMELKRRSFLVSSSIIIGFNRTFMELKPEREHLGEIVRGCVLIVPLWN